MPNEIDLSVFDYPAMKALIATADSDAVRNKLIVDAPFKYKVATTFLFLGIIVLLFVDEDGKYVNRVALSNTELAKNTTEVSYVPFKEIKIPVDHPENIISVAIRTGKPQDTTDWKYLFEPALTPDQARLNQASGGIAYSAVYPLTNVKQGAAMIFSYFQYQQHIGSPQHDFMDKYSTIVNDFLTA